MLDLLAHELDHLVAAAPSMRQQVDAAADRHQRIAQLVAEGGEELVLAAVGLAQLLIEPAFSIAVADAVRQVLRRGQVAVVVAPSRLGEPEAERADQPSVGRQRNAEVGLEAEVAQAASSSSACAA